MDEKNVAFHDLPAHYFPLKITCLDIDTDELLWEQTLEGPGVLRIAPKPKHVRETRIITEYGDGTTVVVPPR